MNVILPQLSCFKNIFPLAVSSRTTYISLKTGTTNCRFYSDISQILLLYKVWGYYNKFDSMTSLGVYYWYIKIPRCWCAEHGLEYITFYFQKYIEHLAPCSGPPVGSRRAARGTRICKNRLFKWATTRSRRQTFEKIMQEYIVHTFFVQGMMS